VGLQEQSRLSSCVVVYCDLRRAPADAQTVEGLARLQLAIQRCGHEMKLRGASEELRELIGFMGLGEVLVE
jgi:hypothetical protein